jgi:hypothetical protein
MKRLMCEICHYWKGMAGIVSIVKGVMITSYMKAIPQEEEYVKYSLFGVKMLSKRQVMKEKEHHKTREVIMCTGCLHNNMKSDNFVDFVMSDDDRKEWESSYPEWYLNVVLSHHGKMQNKVMNNLWGSLMTNKEGYSRIKFEDFLDVMTDYDDMDSLPKKFIRKGMFQNHEEFVSWFESIPINSKIFTDCSEWMEFDDSMSKMHRYKVNKSATVDIKDLI